jgi:hypothetical protein
LFHPLVAIPVLDDNGLPTYDFEAIQQHFTLYDAKSSRDLTALDFKMAHSKAMDRVQAGEIRLGGCSKRGFQGLIRKGLDA